AGAGAVVDGKTGFVVPAGDPDALASAMQRLAGLPREAREAMARAAREHAVAHFEMERAVAEWERLYGELGGT
ncbi:MAG: glycosyl transferase family 1, partial [Acidobacteriia bacterium]|nr:glycosyl transferase family 1 [Terriglobia bacterium]